MFVRAVAGINYRSAAEAGQLMRRDAGRIRLTEAGDKVGLFDGADWIKNQVKRQSLPLDDLGLDFYHLAENVHKARRAVYGEEDPHDPPAPGNAWAAGLLHTAKHQGYPALHEELAAWKAKRRGRKQRAAAQRLLDYVEDRQEMIKYPQFVVEYWTVLTDRAHLPSSSRRASPAAVK